MGLLVNIVAADEDEIEAVGVSQRPVDEWSGFEVREIDTAKLATLHCLLSEDDYEASISAYEPVFAAGDEGVYVLRIPDDITLKLAEMEEDALDQVGEELAATEEFELQQWDVEEVQMFITQLADLARIADSQGQSLLVWMHPLNT
jgi:hypothetical protein